MNVDIQITQRPIPPAQCSYGAGGAGALVQFRGVVRPEEQGEPIAALEYDAYCEMALRSMRQIVEELSERFPCHSVQVIHRVGQVPVGEAAISVIAASAHRREALEMVSGFLDRLKLDVPIWKTRVVPVVDSKKESSTSSPQDRLLDTDEVIGLIRLKSSCLETESVQLAQAQGRILRSSVRAPEDQPAFDRSSMDGFAVRLDDPSLRFEIVDEIRAGQFKPRTLEKGQALRISTGAALPCDGLQVVMKEHALDAGSTVTVSERDSERNIRFRGEDARHGTEIIPSGTLLRPGSLALLASIGCVSPEVTRRPRVLHAVTGDEIVRCDQTPKPGQIRDSNSTLVRAFLQEWQVELRQVRLPEDHETAREILREHWECGTDLLLISGGASVGEHDSTRHLIEELGFTVHFSKSNTRPGKPLIFATGPTGVAFGLPGNPLSHFVCLNLFVGVALARMVGQSEDLHFQAGRLTCNFEGNSGSRETFWPAQISQGPETPLVQPLSWKNSGDITSLATTNALLRLSPNTGRLDAQSLVQFLAVSRNL